MQYWRSYWETCSTGGHIGKHAVLEVIGTRLGETCSTGGLSEETCSTGGHIGKHAVLEVLVRNMQYWRS